MIAEVENLSVDSSKLGGNADPAKQLKKLNKVLRQINDIAARVEKGEELTEDQMKKLAKRAEIEKEIEQLS